MCAAQEASERSGFESGERMSASEEFSLQEFVYVIRSMSAFPFVLLCKYQSRLKVSAQINCPCRKKVFISSFFSSRVLTQPHSSLKSAESFFFHFKFPKHWFKSVPSSTFV